MLSDERVNTPIATRELERRWKAVRTAMKAAGIDVLLTQANQDFMGGYVKWFTDLPATQGYTEIVVFPRDEGMTMIGQGPFGVDRRLPPEGDGRRRGVDRVLSAAIYASAGYSHAYDAELTAKALAPHARATIGLVGLSTLSHHLIDALRTGPLSDATFVDATDLIDRIKAIKSADEIAVIRETAAMQDRAMTAAFAAFRPGARDRDVTAAAEYASLREGSEQGLYMCASSPIGVGVQFANRHYQNRVIQPGDQMSLLIENSGAGGYYCELGRTATLGPPTAAMRNGLAFVREARAFMLDRLRPGASCPAIWTEYNAFMRAHGKPEEDRLHCHSMGYDLVERPLVRFDEPMTLAAGMVVSCHPTWFDDGGLHWLCDNYLIGEDATERLHAFPETITELN
ncbi:M24 family metallopeptidase [Sphingomonas sp.]|jgi:Xaa-Pro aminopeptidase|uniref:M24 family metallopeptidase n=1 Tax=Sphingomonas sp. TaxID=28214 RepID=UPI002ED8EAEA